MGVLALYALNPRGHQKRTSSIKVALSPSYYQAPELCGRAPKPCSPCDSLATIRFPQREIRSNGSCFRTSCSVPAYTNTFSATIISGIQDISALLPLLGTEQCEEHVSSALTNGYLYAAASPMSLFGSLGLARAGFKTFLAGANFFVGKWHFNGAQMLSNMGFQPQGANLSLIMVDQENKGRYVVESRLNTFLEELHLDKTEVHGVSHNTKKWNVTVTVLTAFASSLSILPYVYLNTRAGSTLSPLARWSFPALRAAGGFLTTTTMQLVIQRRTALIIQTRLSERHKCRKNNHSDRNQNDTSKGDGGTLGEEGLNPEKGLGDSGAMRNTTDGLTWILLFLLFLGAIISVVGYVGCFSVVQSVKTSRGPLSWLIMEAGLSLVRIILWGFNPLSDHAPPLEFTLKLDDKPPLPTCNRNDDHIWEDKVLPLTRASYFLNSITSYAGLIKHFNWPGLTLYYTLTRAGPGLKHNKSKPQRSLNERVLYITIFDHKERTARVFTQVGEVNHFYSAAVPAVDLEHDLLETQLGEEIKISNDPIAGDGDILILLVEHYRSLLHATNRQVFHNHEYRIGNAWTMKAFNVITAPDEQPGGRDGFLERDSLYFEQGQIERMRKSLDEKRGRWIESYMHLVVVETWDFFQGEKTVIRKLDDTLAGGAEADGKEEIATNGKLMVMESDGRTADEDWTVGSAFIVERVRMEKLLVHEVDEWEGKLWNVTQGFICREDVQEKERVERVWKANCWARLNANIQAMDARMDAAKADAKGVCVDLSWQWREAHEDMQSTWRAVMDRFTSVNHSQQLPSTFNLESLTQNFVTLSVYPDVSPFSSQQDEVERRLRNELEDVEFRLNQGLEKCDEFWVDEDLLRCRHSRSKWLRIPYTYDQALLAVYSRALKVRDDVIYIDFYRCHDDWVADTIRNMPHLTSICTYSDHLGNIQRDTPLFMGIFGADMAAFLERNKLQFAETRDTFIYIKNGRLPDFTIPTQLGLHETLTMAVSFFGPTYGNLTLRLRHRASKPSATLIIDDLTGSPTFQLPIRSTLGIDDITLYPRPAPSGRISFEQDARNNLMIQISSVGHSLYWLRDIQLLDEGRCLYNQAYSSRYIPSMDEMLRPASPEADEIPLPSKYYLPMTSSSSAAAL